MIWTAVLAGALGCYLLKLAGLSVRRHGCSHGRPPSGSPT